MEHLNAIIVLHNNSKTLLAKHLKSICPNSKISQAHINNWITRDGKVPSEWVLPLALSSGWQKTPHDLRPDLYPHPNDGLPHELRCACEEKSS